MPTVPEYGNGAPTQTLRPLADNREQSIASPELLSAGARQLGNLAQGAVQAGSQITDIAIDMQRRDNANKVFTAETGIGSEFAPFDAQIRQRRGANAKGTTQEVTQWWDDAEKRYGDTLDNDAQRALFQHSVSQLRQRAVLSTSQHEAEQGFEAVAQSSAASAQNEIDFSAAHITEPDGDVLAQQAKQRGLERVRAASNLNGDLPETAAAKESSYLTNFHKQNIQALVDSDPTRAQAYYDANKGEIAGSEQDTVEKALKTGGIKKVAQDAATAMTAMGMSEAEGLDHIREKYSGDEQEAVSLEWRQRWAQNRQAREATQSDNADQAFKIYAQTGRISAIPSDVWNGLDGKVQIALKDKAKADVEGRAVKTDFGTYYQLYQQGIQDPSGFAKVDLRKYVSTISEADLKSLATLQSKANKPDELKDVSTLQEQLSTAHNTLGWGSSDEKKKGAFDNAVRNALDAEQVRQGKQLNYAERQKLIDRMVIDGKIQGSGVFYDTRGKFYEFQGTEDAAKFVPSIPTTERAKIEGALRRRNLPVTDDAVMNLYKRQHGLP